MKIINSLKQVIIFTNSILASNRFFYAALVVATIQAVWYALSFQPYLFDEPKHLGRIYAYLQQLGPFFSQQDPSWDQFGQLVRDESYLFYYIMSWPLRFIRIFTDNAVVQVVFLRLVCASFFVTGLIIYRKVLLNLSEGSRGIANIALLFVILTPAFAPLPGSVNYDNLIFLMFGCLLLLTVKIAKNREVNLLVLIAALTLCLLMTVVKWAAIALVAPVLMYLGYILLSRYGTRGVPYLIRTARSTSWLKLTLALLALVISMGLFVERPVLNTLQYGKPKPSCFKVMSEERCLKSHEISVYAQVAANKPADFRPVDPIQYFITMWLPRMVNTSVSLLPWSAVVLAPSLPVMDFLYFTFTLTGAVLVLIYLRDYMKHRSYRLVLFVMGGYILLLFLELYRGYTLHAIPAAISARYLMPVTPILFFFVALSITRLFSKHRLALVACAWVVLLLFTQGGGMITHSLTAKEELYWPNDKVRVVNEKLNRVLRPLVKE